VTGEVDDRGTPIIRLNLGGRDWIAVIDTGFDGDLLLPEELATHFPGPLWGRLRVILGGGQVVIEDVFTVSFPFDGELRYLKASFAPVEELLIGTAMLANYRLEINFATRTLILEKVSVP
jgi:predicted aspartyl protease